MTKSARSFPSVWFSAAALLLLVFSVAPSMAEVRIQEVKSSKGITAWLVEDYSVPVVSLRFAFEGGSTQDPAGKEGLANLMTTLFDEGAGDLDSEAFQIRLDDAGAEMGFSASSDEIYGSMRMLAEQKDEAFELLRLAINKPRFDQGPIDRMRSQIIAGIIASERTPEAAAGRKWLETVYGDHPYARRDDGSKETLASISPDDLRKFHKAIFARGDLRVGVVGAIDAETLKRELDKLFGDLPEQPQLTPVADITPKFGQSINVTYDLPQTTLRLAYPGVSRKDPEFFAAFLMNHIFGGGTFSSRLFNEVREKRGLAYGVDSSLASNRHSNMLAVSTATRADRAAETLKVIRETVTQMIAEGPTEAELEAAKKYVIGAYPINNLDSSSAIARTLVELQIDDLGIDYMERRADIINAVTLDQVKAVAKRLLSVEPTVLVLGPAAGAGQ